MSLGSSKRQIASSACDAAGGEFAGRHRSGGCRANLLPVLLIDAANVVGSRPTGWWRDRAGAARSLVDRVRAAVDSGRIARPVTIVLEGKAREGAEMGVADGLTVLHATGGGDDTLIDVATKASDQVTLVTADRELRRRAEAVGARVVGPGWLLELVEP